MPNENNRFLTANTSKQQIETYKQEKNNRYFEEEQRFKDQAMNLQENKRTILGFRREDSREMREVKGSLQALSEFFNRVVPAEPGAFEAGRIEGHERYQTLIRHCQTYIAAKGNPATSSGKARLEMVKAIYHQCREEEKLFDDCARSLYAEGRKDSIQWSNLLGEVRMAQINADNFETEKVGRVTKPIWRLKQKDQSVYFRSEERTKPDDKALFLEEYRELVKDREGEFSMVYEMVQRNPDILEKASRFRRVFVDARGEKEKELGVLTEGTSEYKTVSEQLKGINHLLDLFAGRSDNFQFEATEWKIVDGLMNKMKNEVLPREKLTDEPRLWTINGLTSYMRAAGFVKTQSSIVKQYRKMGIEEGSSISVRNVAASRLAGLLGTSGLFVKSRTAVIEQNGEKKKGTLMMEASGESFRKLERKAQEEHLKLEYSPEMIRQLTILQIMDTLFGCMDRSDEDFFAESHVEGGRLIVTGLTAINNEYSFGVYSYEEVTDTEDGIESPFVDELDDEKCYLPAMDRQLYDHMINLSSEEIDYALKDILTDKELGALKSRLAGIQNVLEKTAEQAPDFLVNKEDWEAASGRFAAVDNTYVSTKYIKGNHI